MNINDFKSIQKQLNKRVHYDYDLIHTALYRMDSIPMNANLHCAQHSQITTLGKAEHLFDTKVKTYNKEVHSQKHHFHGVELINAMDQLDYCKSMVRKLKRLVGNGYTSSTTVLLTPIKTLSDTTTGRFINAIASIILTKASLFHLISEYGFITAGQLEANFAKAMHKLPEESAMNIKKKVNLSRHYLAIKAAVPDKAILNISSVLADHDSIKELMCSASHVHTDVQEAVPYIRKESRKANNLLHDVKSIINTQIDGKSAYMMFTTTKLEMNEKYMQMSHKNLADAVRKRQLI